LNGSIPVSKTVEFYLCLNTLEVGNSVGNPWNCYQESAIDSVDLRFATDKLGKLYGQPQIRIFEAFFGFLFSDNDFSHKFHNIIGN